MPKYNMKQSRVLKHLFAGPKYNIHCFGGFQIKKGIRDLSKKNCSETKLTVRNNRHQMTLKITTKNTFYSEIIITIVIAMSSLLLRCTAMYALRE